MANLLVFGGGLQAISVARSLKEAGHVVFLAAKHDKIAAHSNYIDEYIDIVDDRDIQIVINTLTRIVVEKKIDIIFPMEDAQAESLSRCKETIETMGVKCAVMDFETFSWVSDKTRLLSFCKENGFPHPKTMLIKQRKIDEAVEYVGFPSLIKPSHSEGAKGIELVVNYEELLQKLSQIVTQYGECSLQEYIATKSYYYNVMLYRGLDGSWGNYCIIQILRYYPIGGGSSSSCVTVENDELVKLCKAVLEKIEWKGFADFDILEKDDGDYRIIEINPRVPASIRAAAVSGINFPEQIVQDLLTGKFPIYDYHAGKYLRYLGLDIAWFLASNRRWKCKPSWFCFWGKDIFYQEGGLKDVRAMCISMLEGVKKQLDSDYRKGKNGLNKKI